MQTIRTLLHAILATAELLAQQLTDAQHRQKLSLFIDSSEYLLGVLKDILDVAKMEKGELQLNISQFDLAEVTHQVEQLFNAHASQKGLILDVADAFPETIHDCIAAGMDEYLTKPFKQKEMLTVIERVLHP